MRTISCLVLRLREDRGSTATEYALLAALIAVVIVVAVTAFGLDVLALFDDAQLRIDQIR